MDAVFAMAANVAKVGYEDLSGDVIQATKNDILDTLGTAIAGSAAPGCKELVETILLTYDKPQASIWVYGHKMPAPEAALANGTMGHALDFDDTHDGAVLHAGVSVVPAAFAVAEQLGRRGGKDLITAVTLGIDWLCRMGLASMVSPIASGWMYTSTCGFFGATAAATKLMGLDVDRIVDAMGIAYAQAAGNTQCMTDGALTKRMQPGFAARAGVLSALLAKNGITGVRNIFDGEAGYYRVYLKGAYDRDRLLAELGSRFEGVTLSYKPFPACRHTHTAIEAALELAKRHAIRSEDVEEIRVGVNQQAHRNVCTPVEVKSRPRTIVDAQFSVPYCVATAITKKEVFIDDFTEQAIGNPVVIRLAQKVTSCVDDEMEKKYSRQTTPARVSIRLKGGVVHESLKIIPRGSPENPMGFDELAEKFRRCAGYARIPLPRERVDRAIELVRNLESVPDVQEIVKMLV